MYEFIRDDQQCLPRKLLMSFLLKKDLIDQDVENISNDDQLFK